MTKLFFLPKYFKYLLNKEEILLFFATFVCCGSHSFLEVLDLPNTCGELTYVNAYLTKACGERVDKKLLKIIENYHVKKQMKHQVSMY